MKEKMEQGDEDKALGRVSGIDECGPRSQSLGE